MSLKIKYISIIITCCFRNQSDSEIALMILEIIVCYLDLYILISWNFTVTHMIVIFAMIITTEIMPQYYYFLHSWLLQLVKPSADKTGHCKLHATLFYTSSTSSRRRCPTANYVFDQSDIEDLKSGSLAALTWVFFIHFKRSDWSTFEMSIEDTLFSCIEERLPIVTMLNLYRSTDAIIMHWLSKICTCFEHNPEILDQIFPQNYIKMILFNAFHEFLRYCHGWDNKVLKYKFLQKTEIH